MPAEINFKLELAEVGEFKADVLVLKYSQGNDVDKVISHDFNISETDLKKIRPKNGKSVLIENTGTAKYSKILFIGVPHPDDFRYQEIREFAASAMMHLKKMAPGTQHIAMTIAGVGYGLDEKEAVQSQLAGVFEAIQSGLFPKNLQRISIVVPNHAQFSRLEKVIDSNLTNFSPVINKGPDKTYLIDTEKLRVDRKEKKIESIIDAGKTSENKKHIFVAMPFKEDMGDTFYYGIQQPINNNNFLCERVDLDNFTGDVLTRIKSKIETASAVVADMTTQNPNVYLEVGYAWGIGKPTIFVIKDNEKLRFDVQGYRCLQYRSIKHLEEILTKEIAGLVKNGEIK